MYTALILIAVGAVALIVFGCVQIVVGARDANLTTDLDSQRRVEINDQDKDKGKGSVTTTTTTTDTSTTTQEQKKK